MSEEATNSREPRLTKDLLDRIFGRVGSAMSDERDKVLECKREDDFYPILLKSINGTENVVCTRDKESDRRPESCWFGSRPRGADLLLNLGGTASIPIEVKFVRKKSGSVNRWDIRNGILQTLEYALLYRSTSAILVVVDATKETDGDNVTIGDKEKLLLQGLSVKNPLASDPPEAINLWLVRLQIGGSEWRCDVFSEGVIGIRDRLLPLQD